MEDNARKVKYDIKNFVGTFHELFDADFCDEIVKHYEVEIEAGHGISRLTFENALQTEKDDTQLFDGQVISIPLRQHAKKFNEIFWSYVIPIYEQHFGVLNKSERYSSYHFKIQKTIVGGGYHIWHYESDGKGQSNRLLTWILYLNDVEEGGETEFLYTSMRVKPKKGTLILFPAAFTHTHRGNPPISNEKYIVTGWCEF